MTRLLFFLALAVFGLIAARRWTDKLGGGGSQGGGGGKGRGGSGGADGRGANPGGSQRRSGRPVPPRPVRDDSVARVVCAACRTEYRPEETAWQCPTCKR